MTKTYKKGVGGFDTTGFPTGDRPTEIQSVRNPSASLETATDVTRDMGPAAPRVKRGTRPPAIGPHRPK
jgi:hypothetical protein